MSLILVILAFVVLAAAFARYLVKQDRGEREPVRALWAAFGLGMLGLPVAAAMELWLLPELSSGNLVGQGLGYLALVALGVGVIEELAKCLPLMFFLYKKRYFNERTDGVIYFALAGLGFGLPENILYAFQFGAEAGLMRIVLTPLFHAATTALVGYALIRCKLDKKSPLSVVAVLLLAIGAHTLYDFGLFSGQVGLVYVSIMITFALAIGVFMLFLYARSLDELKGQSAVGHNSFCRTCGKPNPQHKLYCSACGNRA